MSIEVDHNNEFTSNMEFWRFKGELDFVDKWFLMGSPLPILTISMAYLLFVTKLGPYYMKKRKAYSLTKLLLIYNVGQVALSTYMFYLCLKVLIPLGLFFKTCNMETEESRYLITSTNYVFIICKLTELLDTVFFVLRKKQKQVSFLHVYHHFLMAWCSWILLKYEPGYSLLFTGTINSFIHILMYFYYGLSAFPGIAKYLWWKKYITKMQLIQFCLILIHFTSNTVTSECKPSKILTATIVINILLFLYLFFKFYIESYKTSHTETIEGIKEKNGGITHDSEIFNNKTHKRRTKDTDSIRTEEMFYGAKRNYYDKEEKPHHMKKDRPFGQNFHRR